MMTVIRNEVVDCSYTAADAAAAVDIHHRKHSDCIHVVRCVDIDRVSHNQCADMPAAAVDAVDYRNHKMKRNLNAVVVDVDTDVFDEVHETLMNSCTLLVVNYTAAAADNRMSSVGNLDCNSVGILDAAAVGAADCC